MIEFAIVFYKDQSYYSGHESHGAFKEGEQQAFILITLGVVECGLGLV